MAISGVVSARDTGYQIRLWLGILLLLAGFLGHYLAAHAIGGTYIAYRDHMGGFVFLTVVTGAIIAGFGTRFMARAPRHHTPHSWRAAGGNWTFCLYQSVQRTRLAANFDESSIKQ
jgi:hypothetical protein